MIRKITYMIFALVASMSIWGATFDIDPQGSQPIQLKTETNDLVLRIPENPTTGYRWQVESLSPGMRVISAEFLPPEAGCCGAPGTVMFDIRLGQDFEGIGVIKLVSVRSWGSQDPSRTLQIKIIKV